MPRDAAWLARALGGRKIGGGWIAPCPAHEDRRPSLSINQGEDGKILFHCHAGCGQGRVIAALRARGLWAESERRRSVPSTSTAVAGAQEYCDADIRTATALALWRATVPPASTPVETYLRSRGLIQPPLATLQFHGGLRHPSGGIWPAMVALVTRGVDDAPLAIHRTYLARDGSGKAPIDPQRMMLGPCRGGAVWLAEPGEELMVGEGIETCLAAMQATALPAWAALSTSGLRALELPGAVREVIVLADGDAAGEAAARDCGRRWHREGRRVRIARPPSGSDFNDPLLGHARPIAEAAR